MHKKKEATHLIERCVPCILLIRFAKRRFIVLSSRRLPTIRFDPSVGNVTILTVAGSGNVKWLCNFKALQEADQSVINPPCSGGLGSCAKKKRESLS